MSQPANRGCRGIRSRAALLSLLVVGGILFQGCSEKKPAGPPVGTTAAERPAGTPAAASAAAVGKTPPATTSESAAAAQPTDAEK